MHYLLPAFCIVLENKYFSSHHYKETFSWLPGEKDGGSPFEMKLTKVAANLLQFSFRETAK
jgi:hypothetical protein